MDQKVEHSKQVIRDAIKKYWPRIAIACSFGKDSMIVTHLAKQIKPDIKVFSVMTKFKPRETFEYLKMMNKQMNLNVTVYMVADRVPDVLKDDGIEVVLLSSERFNKIFSENEKKTGKKLYENLPDECCRLLKVEPTKEAVKDLDAWICGLRNTEGRTRADFKEIEKKGGLVKINPILVWTEADVWRYMAINNIPAHPWYANGYRSLGCEPCSNPGGVLERDGRWKNTSKCGGECGIHTQILK